MSYTNSVQTYLRKQQAATVGSTLQLFFFLFLFFFNVKKLKWFTPHFGTQCQKHLPLLILPARSY